MNECASGGQALWQLEIGWPMPEGVFDITGPCYYRMPEMKRNRYIDHGLCLYLILAIIAVGSPSFRSGKVDRWSTDKFNMQFSTSLQ